MSKINSIRLLSILAMLLYLFVVIFLLLLIVKNLKTIFILGITILFLSFFIFTIFSNIGTKKSNFFYIWLVILSLIAVTIELFYLISEQNNRWIIYIILTLTTIFIFVYGLISNKYKELLLHNEKNKKVKPSFKNPYLIINPKSGNGRAIKANIDKLANKQNIKVIITKKGKDISSYANEAVKAGADVIGISGGDGSIGAVAKVAIDHNLPIVVLPGGTRCHFAKDLGLEPKLITQSLDGFYGQERLVDVGDINGRIFLNNASFGIYADIINHSDYRENKIKVSREVLQSIIAGDKDLYDLKIKHKEININEAVQILVGVNKYETFNLFNLGHRQELDSGELQITAITKLNRKIMKKLLSVFSNNHQILNQKSSGIYQWSDNEVIINSKVDKINVGVDGESETYKTPVKINVRSKALRIFVPNDAIEGRKDNILNYATINKLWKYIWHEVN